MTKNIYVTIKTGLVLAVIFCLAVFSSNKMVSAQEIDDCMECHMDRNLTKTDAAGNVHSLYVDKDAFVGSVHGEMEYTCVDCHEDVKAEEHPKEGIPDVKCGPCHEEALAEYEKSRHGQLLKSGSADAPGCDDCHGIHAVFASDDPKSSANPDNLAATCGKCHAAEAAPALATLTKQYLQGHEDMIAPGIMTTLAGLIPTRVKGHGKVNMACSFDTQQCGNCHFEVLKHADDEMKPKVCANCHLLDRSSFVFGKIHKTGVLQSPVLAILLVILYIAGIAGLIFYFKGGAAKKKPEAKTEE
jgi:5-methylcytosine-specific restriction endonuclease McrA